MSDDIGEIGGFCRDLESSGKFVRYVTTPKSKRNEEEQTLQQEKLRSKLRYNDDGRGRYERPGRH